MKAAFDREWKSVNKQWEEKTNPHRVAKGMYPFSGGQRDSKVTNLKSNENEHTKVANLKSDWVFTKLEQLESKFKERLETMEQRLEIIEQRLQVLSDEIARISPVPPPPASTPPPPGSTPPPPGGEEAGPASPPASPPPSTTAAPRCIMDDPKDLEALEIEADFQRRVVASVSLAEMFTRDENVRNKVRREDGDRWQESQDWPTTATGQQIPLKAEQDEMSHPGAELADWQAVDFKASGDLEEC